MQPKISSRRFKAWKKPKIKHGTPTKWGWTVFYPENLTMGKNVDIGAGTNIFCQNGVTIKDNVQIGGNCSIYSESTIDNKKGTVVLKENCRIGANSVLMPNITIGKNAVCGALSFINKDVPDNCLAMGIPVKIYENPPI
jgi:acetyltransferase-like isoleucine patch superfamily enzyme